MPLEVWVYILAVAMVAVMVIKFVEIACNAVTNYFESKIRKAHYQQVKESLKNKEIKQK